VIYLSLLVAYFFCVAVYFGAKAGRLQRTVNYAARASLEIRDKVYSGRWTVDEIKPDVNALARTLLAEKKEDGR
jgi:hypothetical protein